MNPCELKTKTFNHSTKSNKWQKLREKQESPENALEVCHPAGPEPAIQQPAAEAPLSQVHVDTTTGFDTRKVLGLQPRLFDTSIMAEGAVYLDLCLIFLLFRFSLLKQGVLITRVIHQFRRYFPAAPYKKTSYLRMRFFRHCKKRTILIAITINWFPKAYSSK